MYFTLCQRSAAENRVSGELQNSQSCPELNVLVDVS